VVTATFNVLYRRGKRLADNLSLRQQDKMSKDHRAFVQWQRFKIRPNPTTKFHQLYKSTASGTLHETNSNTRVGQNEML
jgi:hypothetical protein